MTVQQIRKEWERWVRARKAGLTIEIVWSDQKGYEEYLRRIAK